MILFAFGGKCGSPVIISSSLLLPNRSGINKEPNAALPIPKLNLDKKRRRFMLRPCSRISFSIEVILCFSETLVNFCDPDSYRDFVSFVTKRSYYCLLYTSDAADERSSVD